MVLYRTLRRVPWLWRNNCCCHQRLQWSVPDSSLLYLFLLLLHYIFADSFLWSIFSCTLPLLHLFLLLLLLYLFLHFPLLYLFLFLPLLHLFLHFPWIHIFMPPPLYFSCPILCNIFSFTFCFIFSCSFLCYIYFCIFLCFIFSCPLLSTSFPAASSATSFDPSSTSSYPAPISATSFLCVSLPGSSFETSFLTPSSSPSFPSPSYLISHILSFNFLCLIFPCSATCFPALICFIFSFSKQNKYSD